jgi:hypothetical protein
VIAAPAGSLLEALQQVPDPRGAQGRRFSLAAMLAAIVCAILSGARGYSAISEWIHAQPKQVWWMLGFYRRPPTTGAFRNLLMAIDSAALEQVLRDWILPHVDVPSEELEALAIDGKTLCSTLGEHGRSIQLLSLFDAKSGCVLSQMPVPTTTNEAKAALEILKTLVLEGRVVTGDAMFAKPEICRAIIDSGGDYLLVIKDNNFDTKETIAGEFLPAFSPRYSA